MLDLAYIPKCSGEPVPFINAVTWQPLVELVTAILTYYRISIARRTIKNTEIPAKRW
jgi:hypothetical protein